MPVTGHRAQSLGGTRLGRREACRGYSVGRENPVVRLNMSSVDGTADVLTGPSSSLTQVQLREAGTKL